MTKIVYNVLKTDSDGEIDILIACHSREQAIIFQDLYILEEYGTSFDMRAAGVELAIEPTFLQTDKITWEGLMKGTYEVKL